MILDAIDSEELDALFRPLENQRFSEVVLGKEKAKGGQRRGHGSWLRLSEGAFDLDGFYNLTNR